MAWTVDDLVALDAAIATGAQKVRYQTHEVEYRSMAEMLQVRDLIKSEIAGPSTNGGAIYVEYGSDY